MQMATRVSFAVSSRWPCTLAWYLTSWSVGSWYWRMRSTSEWQLPQTPTVVVRSGLPMKPAADDIATVTSSDVGSPPWQLAHPIPFWPWTLSFHCWAMSCCVSSIAVWHA